MPSSNKTSLGLNLWSGTDKPKKNDFNADNQIIDTALAGKAKHSTGTWDAYLNTGGVTLGALDISKFSKNGNQITLTLRTSLSNIDRNSTVPITFAGIPHPANGFGTAYLEGVLRLSGASDLGIPMFMLRNTGIIELFFRKATGDTAASGSNLAAGSTQAIWFNITYTTIEN